MKRSLAKTRFGPRLQFAISYKYVLRVLQKTDKYWNYTSCRNVEQGETKCKCYRFCFTVVNLTFTLSSMKFYFTFEQVTVWNIEDRSNPKEKHIAALIGILLFFHNLQTSISFFVCTQARNYLISTKGDS